MGQKSGGTCYVKVDGQQLVIKGNVEAPLGKAKRETLALGYYKEEDVIPFVKAEVLVPKGTPIQKIMDGTNMTVTVEFASGKVYTLSGAYVTGESNYDSEEGKASLEFNGTAGDWS
jgi:hypothetical protein